MKENKNDKRYNAIKEAYYNNIDNYIIRTCENCSLGNNYDKCPEFRIRPSCCPQPIYKDKFIKI